MIPLVFMVFTVYLYKAKIIFNNEYINLLNK